MTCSRKRGGGPLPLKWFDAGDMSSSGGTGGRDLLHASGRGIRPSIGGRRRTIHRRHSYRKRTKGGFVPSVMGDFVASCSKYIVPIALFAGYKLMSRNKKGKRKTRKNK